MFVVVLHQVSFLFLSIGCLASTSMKKFRMKKQQTKKQSIKTIEVIENDEIEKNKTSTINMKMRSPETKRANLNVKGIKMKGMEIQTPKIEANIDPIIKLKSSDIEFKKPKIEMKISNVDTAKIRNKIDKSNLKYSGSNLNELEFQAPRIDEIKVQSPQVEGFTINADDSKELPTNRFNVDKFKTKNSHVIGLDLHGPDLNKIKSKISGLGDEIKEKISDIGDGIKERISDIGDGIKEKVTITNGIKFHKPELDGFEIRSTDHSGIEIKAPKFDKIELHGVDSNGFQIKTPDSSDFKLTKSGQISGFEIKPSETGYKIKEIELESSDLKKIENSDNVIRIESKDFKESLRLEKTSQSKSSNIIEPDEMKIIASKASKHITLPDQQQQQQKQQINEDQERMESNTKNISNQSKERIKIKFTDTMIESIEDGNDRDNSTKQICYR
ncbi:hypothetical protein QR98_0059600 [Sarcoptes scabiei]|uniref:Uncharacterized protein n=1 Tax=Sarcoptes scabiei TaxID=52283 RepID=A0A132A905_SARSC|nr:hypothetical protein QR98_0059600 [Sarcoptes scabiei]